MAGSQDKHGYRYNCKTPKLLRPRCVFLRPRVFTPRVGFEVPSHVPVITRCSKLRTIPTNPGRPLTPLRKRRGGPESCKFHSTQSGQAKGCAQGVAVGDGAEEIDPDEGAAKGAHPLVRLALGHGTVYLKNPSSNSAMPEVLRAELEAAEAAGVAPPSHMLTYQCAGHRGGGGSSCMAARGPQTRIHRQTLPKRCDELCGENGRSGTVPSAPHYSTDLARRSFFLSDTRAWTDGRQVATGSMECDACRRRASRAACPGLINQSPRPERVRTSSELPARRLRAAGSRAGGFRLATIFSPASAVPSRTPLFLPDAPFL